MGQASNKSPMRSTSGMLGLRMNGLHKEKALLKNGQVICGRRKKKKKRTPCTSINLSEYKNTLSSDLTEKCYSQIVFSN